jgi:hypothetical protein
MSILKRNAAVVLLAWAGGGPVRPTVLAAAQTDGSAPPASTPATPPAPPTEAERQARREALRACLEAAGEDAAARQACRPEGLRGPGHHRPGPKHGGPLAGLGLLGKAVHGTAIVPGPTEGSWQTVTFDRGKVEAATDGSKIVLARPDGQTVTLVLNGDTKYHGIADAGAVREGEPAMVISKDGTATHVLQRDPEHREPHGAGRPAPDEMPGNNGGAPVVPND